MGNPICTHCWSSWFSFLFHPSHTFIRMSCLIAAPYANFIFMFSVCHICYLCHFLQVLVCLPEKTAHFFVPLLVKHPFTSWSKMRACIYIHIYIYCLAVLKIFIYYLWLSHIFSLDDSHKGQEVQQGHLLLYLGH